MESILNHSSIQQWLLTEFARRQEKNAGYSLRSFSKHMGVSPAMLSLLIRNKKKLTSQTAQAIAKKCDFSSGEMEHLFKNISRSSNLNNSFPQRELEIDSFELIANWYYFAILALERFKHNSLSAKWIAQKLDIPVNTAQKAVTRLTRLGIIAKNKRGDGFHQATPSLVAQQNVPSAAIRKFHRAILDKAQDSLAGTPVDMREFSATIMPINTKYLPEIKNSIRRFRDEMAAYSESIDNCDEVYSLSIQLFPLTKERRNDDNV